MLLELSIRDLALIQGLTITFGPGLSVFTGETGAGKSIIVDAIELVLGERASNELIRTSAEEATVEALFDVSGQYRVKDVLDASGIPYSENLVIKRIIQRAGKNRIYINGSIATLMTLAEVTRGLVDICGQSEHLSLTRQDEHIELLDGFGGHSALRHEMGEAYRRWNVLKKELDALQRDFSGADRKRELLSYEAKEIEDAGLQIGEDDLLVKEKEKLKHSRALIETTGSAHEVLYSAEGSVVERLGSVLRALKDMGRLDTALNPFIEMLERSLLEIEDVSRGLNSYANSAEVDTSRLEEIETRIDRIVRLKKKYGATIDEILKRKETTDILLKELDGMDEKIKNAALSLDDEKKRALDISSRLGARRKEAAERFKLDVEKELYGLGMKAVVFKVMVEPQAEGFIGEKGSDRVAFLISANPGEELKPLSKVASGGELSRIMLAIKKVSTIGRVPTLIFDEIDTGIGGSMAEIVARMLKSVASASQVFCISHLPHIAAFADTHYYVFKGPHSGNRITTGVKKLAYIERKEELARMLGARHTGEAASKHAEELLERAGKA
ncbi:MAG: DNA repair protein RecN [Deltaproteobacteria bacterium]|nr:DNA repair protein RecN [Deltaproteobacteria bacterium]